MSHLEDRIFAESSLEKVLSAASYREWHLDKAHAIFELAHRAVEDETLLPDAWRCIGAEITFESRMGPPLGQPGAVFLLDNRNHSIEQALVDSMKSWAPQQQMDFFIGVVQRDERGAFLNHLIATYGFEPKIRIGVKGEVMMAD
jgi:hypothetical protein